MVVTITVVYLVMLLTALMLELIPHRQHSVQYTRTPSQIPFGLRQHSIVQYNIAQHSIIQYIIVRYRLVQYSIIQYSSVHFSQILYFTVLHYVQCPYVVLCLRICVHLVLYLMLF